MSALEGGRASRAADGNDNHEQPPRRGTVVAPNYDPTQRRGTTTGEYGRTGVGLMDRSKDKLEGIGGFTNDPGHTTMTAAATGGAGGSERDVAREELPQQERAARD